MAMSIDAQSLIEKLIEVGVSEVPVVGELISELLPLIWSDDDNSYNQEYEELFEALTIYVDTAILNELIAELKEEIKGYAETMSLYSKASNDDKQGLMSVLIGNGLTIQQMFIDVSDNALDIQLIPVASLFIPLHLAVLKEQYLFGSVIYGSDSDNALWEDELNTAVDAYKNYFITNYPKLVNWRSNQNYYWPYTSFSLLSMGYDITAELYNKITPNYAKFTFTSWRSSDEPGLFNSYKDDVCSYLISQWQSGLINQLLPYYYIESFYSASVDSNAKVIKPPLDSLNTLIIGPFTAITQYYSALTQESQYGNAEVSIDSGSIASYSTTNDTNTENTITEIACFYDSNNVLVGLQVNYNGIWGSEIGNCGGTPTTIPITNNEPLSILLTWQMVGKTAGTNAYTVYEESVTSLTIGNNSDENLAFNQMLISIPGLYQLNLINGSDSTQSQIN
ncbi:hypothetical protein EP331_10310, partial [bacterium]